LNTQHLSRALALAAAVAAGPALAQISGSLDINKPGVYGRISLGPQPGVTIPPPTLVYPQPVIIAPAPVAVVQRPIYLYVPPGHAKDWSKHCAQYAACGQPVLFVQEGWVRDRYVERQAWEREHGRHDHGHGHGHGHDKGDHNDDHDDDHDNGHGHGHGHDR
jgi:hypothetical protein